MKLYLNQIETGERNELDLQVLHHAVLSKPIHVCNNVQVSQWTLAKVLDYLTVLEYRVQTMKDVLKESGRSIKMRERT